MTFPRIFFRKMKIQKLVWEITTPPQKKKTSMAMAGKSAFLIGDSVSQLHLQIVDCVDCHLLVFVSVYHPGRGNEATL